MRTGKQTGSEGYTYLYLIRAYRYSSVNFTKVYKVPACDVLEKTKSRPRLRSRGISVEIRCKSNIMPLKSLLYAMAYAIKYVVRPKNSNATLFVHKLVVHTKNLNSMATSLKGSAEIDPKTHSQGIQSAVNAYVDLFYNASRDERKFFIEEFNKRVKTKVRMERNLLVLPALVAELKLPKDEVSKKLFYSLYKMPLKILFDSSKTALHVALLEQNMAISTVPYDTVEKFSKSMSKLESRIKSVEKGEIDPDEDEDVKADFIEKAVEFSKATEINIADLISEKVGTDSAISARMHRIMRRGRY